jgi:DNA polymerase-4
MEKRLARHGIRTVEQLCTRSREDLRAVWGGVGGEVMHDRLRGEAVAGRESDTQSISHSSVLAPEKRNATDALAILDRLVQKAAVRLRKSGHYASRFTVGLKYLDGSRWDADMRLVDTQDTVTFLHVLEKLWASRPKDRRTILQVGMAFSDLVSEAGHTGSLFAAESKSKSLYATLDRLNARFGKQAVYFASAHKARDRGGLHIAFNHIPDPETER